MPVDISGMVHAFQEHRFGKEIGFSALSRACKKKEPVGLVVINRFGDGAMGYIKYPTKVNDKIRVGNFWIPRPTSRKLRAPIIGTNCGASIISIFSVVCKSPCFYLWSPESPSHLGQLVFPTLPASDDCRYCWSANVKTSQPVCIMGWSRFLFDALDEAEKRGEIDFIPDGANLCEILHKELCDKFYFPPISTRNQFCKALNGFRKILLQNYQKEGIARIEPSTKDMYGLPEVLSFALHEREDNTHGNVRVSKRLRKALLRQRETAPGFDPEDFPQF